MHFGSKISQGTLRTPGREGKVRIMRAGPIDGQAEPGVGSRVDEEGRRWSLSAMEPREKTAGTNRPAGKAPIETRIEERHDDE
ncbi:MAG: hypothetical protein D6757_00350 [Alphaproteobacteria bacterium]|nr:MAG: hypothetical protein D6757_00350 [Alphaproteobacteria bacterium]